ncbi:MAG: ammonia-forming cytochrome c nitrite reductase subunit c552, partial [Acidobacteria bacterium]
MATTSNDSGGSPKRTLRFYLVLALISGLAIIAGLALLLNILQRKQEARNPFYRVVELDDSIEDPEI